MAGTSLQRDKCVFSCKEQMCLSLDKAGVPQDSKWRTMILYMRAMRDHAQLNDSQKSELQTTILSTILDKRYSEDSFRELVRQSERILNAPYIERMHETVRESEEFLREFQAVLKKRRGDVQQLEVSTVGVIEGGRNPQSIIREVRRAFLQVVTVMEEDEAKLDHLSRTDGLTGIANRRAFDDFLKKSVSSSLEAAMPLSLVLLDVDHFKKFNDTYGHPIGDQALISVAKVLRNSAEEKNKGNAAEVFCARYGGEEFAMVMMGADVASAFRYADSVRKNIESYNFIIRDRGGAVTQSNITITASFGVAQMGAGKKGSSVKILESLIEDADAALYSAKMQGRNMTVRS